VDCTSDDGKILCQEYEVRGYPTLLFFPSDEEENGLYYKYQGQRSLDQLEKFALTGEYKKSESELIPKRLEGFAYW